jgi:hypothetical protein
MMLPPLTQQGDSLNAACQRSGRLGRHARRVGISSWGRCGVLMLVLGLGVVTGCLLDGLFSLLFLLFVLSLAFFKRVIWLGRH